MRLSISFIAVAVILFSCGGPDKPTYTITAADTVTDTAGRKTVILAPTDGTDQMNHINTGNTTPAQLISFARTSLGVPYKYASTDPKEGFDCSGFITYTFNHFGIAVPRTSADFTNVDHEVPLNDARAGDLVLFTGTDSTSNIVGHMGIVITHPGEELQFIHSTSGRDNGVTISGMTKGYTERFVKVVRIFPQDN